MLIFIVIFLLMSSFTRPLFTLWVLLSLLLYCPYQLSDHQLMLLNVSPLVRITTIIISVMEEDDLMEASVNIIITIVTTLMPGLIFKVSIGFKQQLEAG